MSLSLWHRLSGVLCAGVAVVFAVVGPWVLYNPDAALRPHGIDLSHATTSARAEIRAYYAGTALVVAVLTGRGAAHGQHDLVALRMGLAVVLVLTGGFAMARLVAALTDGKQALAGVDWMASCP